MKSFKTFCVVAFSGLMIGGCGRKDPLDEVVFVDAGEFSVTASEVRDSVLLNKMILEFSGRKVNPQDFVKWANSCAFRAIPGIMGNHLFKIALDEKNIKATEESDRKVLARHSRQMRKKVGTKEELAAIFGTLAEFYLTQFDFESRKTAYLDAFSAAFVITDEEVDDRHEQDVVRHENEMEVYNSATNRGWTAWRDLKNGARWEDIARKYSEDEGQDGSRENYAKFWEMVPKNGSYIPEAVAKAVRSMKVGDFSPPLDTEEGLLIVKVLGDEGNMISTARIMIRLPIFTPVREKGELRKQMLGEAVNEHIRGLLKSQHDRYKFSYPMGTNITYEIFH